MPVDDGEIPMTVIDMQNLSRHPPRATEDDCISEMEKCSLKDNESCHCLWEMMRAVHGIFHWMNTLTCVRKHRKCKAANIGSDDEGEVVDEQLLKLEKSAIPEEEEEQTKELETKEKVEKK